MSTPYTITSNEIICNSSSPRQKQLKKLGVFISFASFQTFNYTKSSTVYNYQFNDRSLGYPGLRKIAYLKIEYAVPYFKLGVSTM